MEVGVEVQRRAETLDEGDRPGLGAGGDGESGLLDEVCGDGAVHHTQDLAQDLRLGGEQEAQGIRERQYPLPNGLLGEDMIDQMRGALYHPPGATRGAEPAALTAEGNQVLVTAGLALNAQKTVLEQAALQVVIELLFDERGQRSAFGFESGEKLRVVSLDDSIEWCLFRAVALVDIPGSNTGLWQSS